MEKITENKRQDSFVLGGYLFIMCDNFAANLDSNFNSNGTYTLTNLDFIKQRMSETPDLPAILCAHYFDKEKETDEFFSFIKNEKRITLLICGHDHLAGVHSLGEKAEDVILYHSGHYSYAGGEYDFQAFGWGFCMAELSPKGIDIAYIEPENFYEKQGEIIKKAHNEKEHIFIRRRDI